MKRTLLAPIALAALALAGAAHAAAYKHVLLISVDGFHAVDLSNYVATHPKSVLAVLAAHGVSYTSAMAPNPSDSFPGTLALTTGGTPFSTGVFYDDSFDREAFKPGSDCKGDSGAEVAFAENVDKDDKKLDAGGTPGDVMSQIDVKNLPMHLKDGKCVPMMPHEFLRVNTVFEVVKAHGGRTAWSDKHAAYELLNGPSGKGVDELYALEQDSIIAGTEKSKTTASYKAERDFDQARLKALLNMIKGKNGAGDKDAVVPMLLGMNFQSVSVGQKLPKSKQAEDEGLTGGYLDANATPGTGLAKQLDYVDGALGELVEGLKAAKLDGETLVIVSAKHGQSPIDPASFQQADDEPYSKMPGYAFHIADDASLIWLDAKDREKNMAPALAYLEAHRKDFGIGAILTGKALSMIYQDPMKDSRTPDIIVNVNPGVVYTDGKKLAEHGGMNWNDRNVALLVSAPNLKAETVPGLVATTQVAPTLLKALGLNPEELKAVQIEHTAGLPGLPF